ALPAALVPGLPPVRWRVRARPGLLRPLLPTLRARPPAHRRHDPEGAARGRARARRPHHGLPLLRGAGGRRTARRPPLRPRRRTQPPRLRHAVHPVRRALNGVLARRGASAYSLALSPRLPPRHRRIPLLEGGVAHAPGRCAHRPGAWPRPAVRRKDRVRVKRASWRAARQVRGTRRPLTPGVVVRRIAAAVPDLGIAAAFI